MRIFTKVDEHGVVEYKTRVMLAAVISAIMLTVVGGGWLMYSVEHAAGNANVTSWRDGIWVVTMTMTTIGYGDFYPVTDGGRVLGWAVFVAGAVELGSLIGIVSSSMGADKSIQNRQLMTMLSELLRKNEALEAHLEMCTAVTANAHHLDVVFEQVEYNSNALRDGFLTAGKDSSGMYMMSVVAYDKETNQQYHRWLPASSRRELHVMFRRYQEQDDEL